METSKSFLNCESFSNITDSEDEVVCSWAWIDQMSGVPKVLDLVNISGLCKLNIDLQEKAEDKLNTMVTLYTFFYAAALFISGIIAERSHKMH